MLNNPKQPLDARNLLKISYFERELSKSLKKVNFIFFSNPVPFTGQSYQRRKLSGIRHQSHFRSQNKFRKVPLFVLYYLTNFDDAMWNRFWVIPKIIYASLRKSDHDIISYSTSICPLESGKCGKDEKNHKTLNILRTKRDF